MGGERDGALGSTVCGNLVALTESLYISHLASRVAERRGVWQMLPSKIPYLSLRDSGCVPSHS
jgi:hypothetical protein